MSNYRSISILLVISKILERAVHEQLLKYPEQNKILSKNQLGSRKKHSTEVATLYFVDEISKQIDNGTVVGALYIDLSSAFDTLRHAVFFVKTFENFLKRSKAINFADDTVVFLPGKTHLEIEQGLGFGLVNISNSFFEDEFVIILNPGRTESMLFAWGRELSQNKKPLKLEYKSQAIVLTAGYKYLGTILDQT